MTAILGELGTPHGGEGAHLTQRVERYLDRSFLLLERGEPIAITDRLFHLLRSRDLATADQAVRVSRYCLMLASVMGLGEEERSQLYVAARLRDLGTLLLPSDPADQGRAVGARHKAARRLHTELGEQFLKAAKAPAILCQAVRHHHERWDGTGYPDGLAGEQIPLLARIIAVCDTFDARIDYRPYRFATGVVEALAELRQARGKQLDPALVDEFLSLAQSALERVAAYHVGLTSGTMARALY